MFDVAPTELLLVLVVALIIIGPKDLPKAMRFVGKWMGKARATARHFRAGLDAAMREAELAELEKEWRKQNDEIMRQFPNIDGQTGSAKDAAPQSDMDGKLESVPPDAEGVEAQNPDFAAASEGPMSDKISDPAAARSADQRPAVDAQNTISDNGPGQVETHRVPPRSSELP